MSIFEQAVVQYAGMAVAFILGWFARTPYKNTEVARCPHHGWDETREQAVSWLHERDIRGRSWVICANCGKLFPESSSQSTGQTLET